MSTTITVRPGSGRTAADEARKALRTARVVERLRRKDHTLWKPEPKEISDRLGWLDSPRTMEGRRGEIRDVVEGIRADGYDFALLLGMGGSSLAPEVFRRVFGKAEGCLDLAVLDSTDPGAVLDFAEGLDLTRTLFIVSTKSGGTVETFFLLQILLHRCRGKARDRGSGQALHRHHRPRERHCRSRPGPRFPPCFSQRSRSRGTLFGPDPLRSRPGGPHRRGPGAPSCEKRSRRR